MKGKTHFNPEFDPYDAEVVKPTVHYAPQIEQTQEQVLKAKPKNDHIPGLSTK
jgi:hypothetical protein